MLLSRLKIKGHSMKPTYNEGEVVIVSSLPYFFSKPKKGDVVVFEKYNRLYLKRITKIIKGKYILEGDNPKDSLDSRKFGSLKKVQIKGKVLFKL